jgi:hypothetical protein
MQKTILPLGLLDFSLAHVQSLKWGCHSRNLHKGVALTPSPAPSFESTEDKIVFKVGCRSISVVQAHAAKVAWMP